VTWYNENDRHAAVWLRELIAQGQIPEGFVDERSILDVRPADCGATSHFFAGIGGWPYALSLAGWPADRPVWTGSCPCQPFSQAGRRRGVEDERHLWPVWRELIRECRPATVFGEQVASKDGRAWLAGVRSDLEAMGYAVGAADLCAAGIGAPHIRQRLWWVGQSTRIGLHYGIGGNENCQKPAVGSGRQAKRMWQPESPESGHNGGVADTGRERRQQVGRSAFGNEATNGRESDGDHVPPGCSQNGGLGDALKSRLEGHAVHGDSGHQPGWVNPWQSRSTAEAGGSIWCRDGVWRRVEPGASPLAHGVSGRVGLLRGYGNAIVPQVAAEFVMAFLDIQKALEEKA